MLYKIYCPGHNRSFKSAGGDVKRGKYFCGGCRKHMMHKLLKSQSEESCGSALDLIDYFKLTQNF